MPTAPENAMPDEFVQSLPCPDLLKTFTYQLYDAFPISCPGNPFEISHDSTTQARHGFSCQQLGQCEVQQLPRHLGLHSSPAP